MIEKFILEILVLMMTLVVGLNATVLKILYGKITENEDDINDLRKDVMSLHRRIFGHEKDETDDGHLVNTEEQFQKLYERLDSISEDRKEEHEEVRQMLEEMVDALAEEEAVDINRRDFIIDD